MVHEGGLQGKEKLGACDPQLISSSIFSDTGRISALRLSVGIPLFPNHSLLAKPWNLAELSNEGLCGVATTKGKGPVLETGQPLPPYCPYVTWGCWPLHS